jgi:RNA polymerase sigma-70 factor (ECF subfamily)
MWREWRVAIPRSAPMESSRVDATAAAEQAADPRAQRLEALYLDHALHVYRYLRARTRSDDEAAELTAVTFEQALRGLGRFRPIRGGARAWLFRIARNAAIDAHRAERSADQALHSLAAQRPRLATPEDAAVDTERLAELRSHVAALPELQRDALHLRYAGGLTAKEIGRLLGKSEAATQKLMTRALARLREAYRDER